MVPTIESSEYTQHPLLPCKYYPFRRFAVPVRKLGAVYESPRRKQIETSSCSSEGACQERFVLCHSDRNRYRNRGNCGRTFPRRSSQFSPRRLWQLQGLCQFTNGGQS